MLFAITTATTSAVRLSTILLNIGKVAIRTYPIAKRLYEKKKKS